MNKVTGYLTLLVSVYSVCSKMEFNRKSVPSVREIAIGAYEDELYGFYGSLL